VTVSTEDGRTIRREIPLVNQTFKRPDWVGFSGLGVVGSAACIDNVVVRIDK